MTAEPVSAERTFSQRMLDGIEKAGNRVPRPVIMFLYHQLMCRGGFGQRNVTNHVYRSADGGGLWLASGP